MLLPCNNYAFTLQQLCFYLAIAMLLPCNSYAFTNSPTLISLGGLLGEIGQDLTSFATLLTYIHNFSAIIPEKYFFVKEVPPFHLIGVISLIINMLYMVELGVELGWNYMKFHPYSTYNSTTPNTLTLNTIIPARWKSGITNEKKYFS